MKYLIFCAGLLSLFAQSLFAQWNGFDSPKRYPNTQNYYVLTRNVNKDSFPDIITSNVYTRNADSFGIFINDGLGNFHDEILVPVRPGYTVWDFGDLNNDSLTDLLTSYYWDNGIRVYTGTDIAVFSEGPLIPTSVHGWLSKISDMDNDGKLDLVNISHGSGNPIRLHIFKGNGDGDGTFAPKVTYESSYSTGRRLNIKDINNDGLPDVILAASFTKIPVFIQNPDHSFTSAEIPVEHGESFDNAIEDMNHDGIQDIVYSPGNFLSEGLTDTIRITLGKGNGVFKPSYTTKELSSVQNPVYLRIADLNRDGNQDIITFDLFTKNLFYFLGNGDSTFVNPGKLSINDTINNFEVADFNRDGFPDIVTVNKDSFITVLLNKGVTSVIEDKPLNLVLKVYPNPFHDFVTVEFETTDNSLVNIRITDMLGRIIQESDIRNTGSKTCYYQWKPKVRAGTYLFYITTLERKEVRKLVCY